MNGFTGLMHNVGHVTFVAKEDIARARAIGATFEVSPYLWGPSPINDAITKAVDEELIARVCRDLALTSREAFGVPATAGARVDPERENKRMSRGLLVTTALMFICMR